MSKTLGYVNEGRGGIQGEHFLQVIEFLPSCSWTFTPFISDVLTLRLGVKRLSNNTLSASDGFANELQTP